MRQKRTRLENNDGTHLASHKEYTKDYKKNTMRQKRTRLENNDCTHLASHVELHRLKFLINLEKLFKETETQISEHVEVCASE